MADRDSMQIPDISTFAPPVPPAPTLPASVGMARARSFAASLGSAMGAPSTAGSVSDASAPASPDLQEQVYAASRGAVTLGAMLRAGASGTTALGATTSLGASLGSMGSLESLLPGASAAVSAATTWTGGTGPFAAHELTVAPVDGRISSHFGERVHPITGATKDHHGMDIAAPTGTPVRSVTDGTVVSAGDRGGYGLTVEVDHGDGVVTRYAHLSAIDVEVGQQLPVGAQLGAVGSTGNSTGPHLHVEVRVDGTPVDPHDAW